MKTEDQETAPHHGSMSSRRHTKSPTTKSNRRILNCGSLSHYFGIVDEARISLATVSLRCRDTETPAASWYLRQTDRHTEHYGNAACPVGNSLVESTARLNVRQRMNQLG